VQVTAIPQGSCAHAAADALNVWSVQNKQDYAQLYGYEFHLSAHDVATGVKVTLEFWLTRSRQRLVDNHWHVAAHFAIWTGVLLWCEWGILQMQGNSNKLMMLQKLLNDTPPVSAGGVDWFWWLDIDTAIDPAQACRTTQEWQPCHACIALLILFHNGSAWVTGPCHTW
jgi:hypothetical protein